MTEDEKRIMIEREGAEALLDRGVSVPWKELHFPFCKWTWKVRVTLRRPCLAGQIRIAQEWLRMGVTADEMWKMDKEAQMRFLVDHGKGISRMIAHCICRGWWSAKLLTRPVAWMVRHWMANDVLVAVMRTYIGLMGTDPFMSIISSVERTNPMKPRLSQGRKGS